MAVSPTVRIDVSGARGKSEADILRATGAYGVLPTDDDLTAELKKNAVAIAASESAAASAALAESASGPTYTSVAAGEAATTVGHSFAVSNGDGTVTVYLRTSGGSAVQRTLATTAALASDETGKGSDLVASSGAPFPAHYLQMLSDIEMGNPISIYRICDRTKLAGIRDFTSTYNVSEVLEDACMNGVRRFIGEYGLFNFESSVVLDRPITIDGAGEGTIFDQRSITDKATFKFKSASNADFISGINFRNFVMRCQTGTFFEQQHFLEFNGAADVNIHGMQFIGFRGDALYFGSGVGGEQRHNRNISISRNLFDGINRENRNAVSVIDGDGVFITENLFRRCTRPNMPGPIDFEPNANAWHIIRAVRVLRNIFEDNGGNVGEVSVFVPPAVTLAPQDIEVSGNHSRGYVGTGNFLYYNEQRISSDTDPDTNLRAVGNVAKNGNRPFSIFNGKKATLERNGWSDFRQSAIVGFDIDALPSGLPRDVSVADKFTRVGTVDGNGISIFNVDGLDLSRSEFADCGTGAPAAANAIRFGKGSSSRVRLDDIRASSPTGKTLVAVQKEATHTFAPTTNRMRGAKIGSLPNGFQADDSDVLMTSYSPVVEGSTTPGTGTYAEAYGRYRCDGDWVVGYYRMSVTTHDGTGAIEISLPREVAAPGSASPLRTVGVANITGLSSINGPVLARINKDAVAGGVTGALRFYTVSSGVETLVGMPPAGTAFVVEGPFAYLAARRA
ncbi:hypothetical protein HH800_05585 [Sphingobium yanoikuyae]|uniref:Right-handed parallel beta-helix repeat-containing protein n=1 Tax=Sphingobium yanoikuyae TaxID=13690 RepID=A0A6M4G475_SPHYA|nr:hypothetical protein [Sphingobium yanoikuyae]QJR01710.1 hypothetical protein HH800_05585 [Sphingobium yanoikuyae]